MKFESVAGVLNSFYKFWYDDKKAESPVRHSTRGNWNSIFPWYVAMKCDTHGENLIFGVDSACYPISLMLHGRIKYDINMKFL